MARRRRCRDEFVRPAIAVLPRFANMSGDPEQEYFADGLTEDIMTDFAGVDLFSSPATRRSLKEPSSQRKNLNRLLLKATTPSTRHHDSGRPPPSSSSCALWQHTSPVQTPTPLSPPTWPTYSVLSVCSHHAPTEQKLRAHSLPPKSARPSPPASSRATPYRSASSTRRATGPPLRPPHPHTLLPFPRTPPHSLHPPPPLSNTPHPPPPTLPLPVISSSTMSTAQHPPPAASLSPPHPTPLAQSCAMRTRASARIGSRRWRRRDWEFCFMPIYSSIIAGLLTRPITEPEVTREVSLVTVAGRRHSPALATFIRAIKAYAWPE